MIWKVFVRMVKDDVKDDVKEDILILMPPRVSVGCGSLR